MKVGVVGATGLVGEVFMRILGDRKFPITELRPFASDRSSGEKVRCAGNYWTVQALSPNCFNGLDLVFFSSGDDISKEWAPEAVKSGAFAIDNSAAFRMHPNFPLVVPEVNAHRIPSRNSPTVIANPNCSTIQLVVALNPLKKWGIKEVHVASYQAVSGAGKSGPEELLLQTREYLQNGKIQSPPQTFAHEIAFNCIPHIGSFSPNGFCSEEIKIMSETKKIMELSQTRVSAFTVRVPALNCHSEAVWVKLDQEVPQDQVYAALEEAPGVHFIEQKKPQEYPTTRHANGADPVFIGRLHRDESDPHTWLMWIVADNILKGAALNGIQIAEKIFDTRKNEL